MLYDPKDEFTRLDKHSRLEILQPKKLFHQKPKRLYPTRYPDLFFSIIFSCFDLESEVKLKIKSTSTPYDPELIPFQNRLPPEYLANGRACQAIGKKQDAAITNLRYDQSGPKLDQVNEAYQFRNVQEQYKKVGYSVKGYQDGYNT